MSETQRQTQQQTGSGQYSQTGTTTPAANTPDIERLRNQQFKVDPSIGYRVGGAVRRMQDRFDNPMGGYATPAMRDAIARGEERELSQMGSQAFREGQQDVNQLEYGRNAMLAGLTQPTTQAQSGTSSQQGRVEGSASQPLLGSIIGSAAGVGAAAL